MTTQASALIPIRWQRADEIDRLAHLPDDVVPARHDAGVYRICEPRVAGGSGLAPAWIPRGQGAGGGLQA